jgi:predicted DNA-binding transcriptional regulator YafY
MRADRLLSILMLLQSRGKLTASVLAEELEVTERTIYRDVTALCTSGVPIYTERGQGGGISLIASYRSDLTGLTTKEVRALFLMSIPPAITELGFDLDLKAAMKKLAATLPSTLRKDEVIARQRFHIDPTHWNYDKSLEPIPHLIQLQRAVLESKIIEIIHNIYVPGRLEPIKSLLLPYGLVTKSSSWYVVANRQDHIYVLRIDRIEEINETGETFTYPNDFNLLHFWNGWCKENDNNRSRYPVKIRVSPVISKRLHFYFKDGFNCEDKINSVDWVNVGLVYESDIQALRHLIQFGGAVEVLEPIALKYVIKDYAEQIILNYH